MNTRNNKVDSDVNKSDLSNNLDPETVAKMRKERRLDKHGTASSGCFGQQPATLSHASTGSKRSARPQTADEYLAKRNFGRLGKAKVDDSDDDPQDALL